MTTELNNWQDVQSEVLRRIQTRVWMPGDLIPNEADLAREFGCARATVNRAMQAVADSGLIDRKRKAGTRVSVNPVRKATLEIPVIRLDIERLGQSYSYSLIERGTVKPPQEIRARMHLETDDEILHLRSVHLADRTPYVYEDRWINSKTVPQSLKVDFEVHNANEWLVANSPFSRGHISFSANQANDTEVEFLKTSPHAALFVVERSTWLAERSITLVRLTYAPGHRLQTTI